MTMKAYTVLGVAPGATVAEIKAAYRERARMIHPDRFADDPRRAQAAHEAFVELSTAFRSALAASAATAAARAASESAAGSASGSAAQAQGANGAQVKRRTVPGAGASRRTPGAQVPGARVPGPVVPQQRRTVTPARESDPMMALLTLPQRCAHQWPAHALEVWALTVVPEARQHLSEARRIAKASGVRSERHLTTATAHVLLSLTVNGLNGPRVMGVLGQLDAAYDALEIVLPRDVVDRLPARLTARRALEDGPHQPARPLLALFAASGALAAATAWTHFFGFFAG